MPVTPARAASRRPSASMAGSGSTAITSRRRGAGGSVRAPLPAPRSSTRWDPSRAKRRPSRANKWGSYAGRTSGMVPAGGAPDPARVARPAVPPVASGPAAPGRRGVTVPDPPPLPLLLGFQAGSFRVMTVGGGAGRRWAVGLWAVLTGMCVCAAGIALVLGLSLVAPQESLERVTVSECETRHAGRNDYVQCDGLLADGTHVSLRHDGHPGEHVDAVKTPWGSYVVPWKGFTAWAAALAAPLALLLAAVACTIALRKALRQTRYRASFSLRWDECAPRSTGRSRGAERPSRPGRRNALVKQGTA